MNSESNQKQNENEKLIEEHTQLILNKIAEYGHTFIEADELTYSVGMSKYGLPDIVCSSLYAGMASTITKMVARLIIKNGFQEGAIDNVIANQNKENIPLMTLIVNDKFEHPYFSVTRYIYSEFPELVGENGVQYVQLLWPDDKGFYPTQPEYDQEAFPQKLISNISIN